MIQAQAAAPSDRLPWLADEPAMPQRRSSRFGPLAAAAATTLVAVAGASYWIGSQSARQPEVEWREPTPAKTVAMSPPPQHAEPAQPQVALEPEPEVRIAPPRDLLLGPSHVPRRQERMSRAPAAHSREKQAEEGPPRVAVAAAPPQSPQVAAPLTPWPAWRSAGASGRIVRIGAFGTRQQAKLGWRFMVDAYPAVAHLKATVVESRNSRGRSFFRFQIGTTSQAHSEVLCQRMERIRLSCAVVGLPWKPGGVER